MASPGADCSLTGPSVSLEFDPDTGDPVIAWIPQIIGDLHYSTYSSSTKTWTSKSINSGKDQGVPSLGFTSTGTPWIAFSQSTSDLSKTHLQVGHKTGSSWTFSTVDSASAVTGYDPSLTFKGVNPLVAYYDGSTKNLRWAKYDGSGWTFETPDSAGDVGRNSSAAFTSSQKAYISYWDDTKNDVRWARPS